MWADAETDIDYLNYSEVAEMVSELLLDDSLLPISLGIFGGWGTGKSSTLRLVETELKEQPDKFLIVKFDAWLYQNFDDARAALMGVISKTLCAEAPESMKSKAVALIGRVNKMRALSLALEGGALALGMPAFGAITKGVEGLSNFVSGDAGSDELKQPQDAGSNIQEKASGLLKPEEIKAPPEEIDAFRVEFSELLDSVGKTLVVFIDNLDRCLPKNAIETLEAVTLFLFMPQTAFIVAADEDMIRHSVSQHFNNPTQRHVTDYLDKLIQVPIRVPRAGIQEIRAYLFLLLANRSDLSSDELEAFRKTLIDRLRQSWREDSDFTVTSALHDAAIEASPELLNSLEMADRVAPLLAQAPGVLGNPRTVKRMLNVVRMRTSIARRRGMPLDEAMITKLALFERCTDIDATEGFHNLINESSNGQPSIIADLERAGSGDEIANFPKPWEKHEDFIRNWAQLLPHFSDVDLRPAVYLSRETVSVRQKSGSLSSSAQDAVSTLIQVRTINSPSAKSALAALSVPEFPRVMETIIEAMRKDTNWKRSRSDFRGAVMVADKSDEAAAALVRFFKSLQFDKTPAWISTMVKDKTWWNE